LVDIADKVDGALREALDAVGRHKSSKPRDINSSSSSPRSSVMPE
jgi:hypothetical protein